MTRRFHLPTAALAGGLLLAVSACSSTPSTSTRHYSVSPPAAADPVPPREAPVSESAATSLSDALRADSPRGHELVLRANDARFRQGAAAPKEGGGGDDAAAVGKKLSNPVSDVWALFTEFDYVKNNGTLTGGRDSKTVGVNMVFQPIMPIPLTENWKLITRPTLPIFFSTPVPRLDGAGIDFDREAGLGDMALPLVPANKNGMKLGPGTLVGGVGPTFQFPTSTDKDLGTDTWEAGVAVVSVYKTEKTTFVLFPQYWWSVAKSDDDASHTSHGSLLYAFWYELGNAWQVGLAPTVTFNEEGASGNKWNVPVGLMAAKTVQFGKRIIKFQFGLEYSVENQDAYGKEVMFRLNVIPVVASPFSGPLF